MTASTSTSRRRPACRGVIPLGRLGLYKYITMDSTYSMVLRLLGSLDRYLGADAGERFEILRHVRGDWSE